MTMSDRGVHPDLLEEVEAQRAAEATPAPPAATRRRAPSRSSSPAAPDTPDPSAPAGEVVVAGESEAGSERAPMPTEPAEASPPDWMRQVREAQAAPDALAVILKNVPLEDLQKHPQISGWIGNMAQRVAREQSLQQQTEAAERDKTDAWRRGDYYRLGELSASEQEARALQAQQQQASEPFMQSVAEYQRSLPEAVQLEVQNKNYASMADYLKAVHDASVKHDIETAVQAEIRKRQPALDKAALSATVGTEQTPERNGGPSPGVREITDAEIERMTLAEYEQYFDDNGKPRNGVRLRLTRGIDVTRR